MIPIFKYIVALTLGMIVFLLMIGLLQAMAKRSVTKRPITPSVPAISRRKKIALIIEAGEATLKEATSSKEARKVLFIIALLSASLIFLLTFKVIFALMAGILTYVGIYRYFKKKQEKRMEVFNAQLIEGLRIIRSSVRAGQSLSQGIENMVKDTRPPLADEFSEVLRKTRLGVPLSEALDGLSLKIGSKDLRMAVISMNLAKEAGGNMGEILSRLTETMQERQKIKGKVMALTAQGRASGIVMSCIPFLLLGILYVMQPEIMGLLFTTLPGNIMLAVVILMVSAGVLVIDRIVKIDI